MTVALDRSFTCNEHANLLSKLIFILARVIVCWVIQKIMKQCLLEQRRLEDLDLQLIRAHIGLSRTLLVETHLRWRLTREECPLQALSEITTNITLTIAYAHTVTM